MKSFLFAAVVAAAVSVPAARAADTSGYSLSADHKTTTAMHPMGASSSDSVKAPAGLRPIMSNIGYEYPKGRYISNFGWTIGGPSSLVGQVWLGVPFTPKKSGMVNEVDVGVGYVTGGMGITLSIATDAGGVPGSTLASYNVKKMGTFGSCCRLERVFGDSGLPVIGGQTYWVTVTTDGSTADEWAAWTMNDTNQVDFMDAAVDTGTGWQPTQLLPGPSIAVFGS